MFKRRRFPVDIILVCVRWYCKYGISYRDLAEMMQERGVDVYPSTIMRWVHRYAPELEKRVRWYQGTVATSWRVDEMLMDRRNTRAAHRFLGKALTTMRHWPPSSITTDQLGSYPKPLASCNEKASYQAIPSIARASIRRANMGSTHKSSAMKILPANTPVGVPLRGHAIHWK